MTDEEYPEGIPAKPELTPELIGTFMQTVAKSIETYDRLRTAMRECDKDFLIEIFFGIVVAIDAKSDDSGSYPADVLQTIEAHNLEKQFGV